MKEEAGSYAPVVEQEMEFLNNSLNVYRNMVKRYVEVGGIITAEAIGNLYGNAEQLGLSHDWLARFVESQI